MALRRPDAIRSQPRAAAAAVKISARTSNNQIPLLLLQGAPREAHPASAIATKASGFGGQGAGGSDVGMSSAPVPAGGTGRGGTSMAALHSRLPAAAAAAASLAPATAGGRVNDTAIRCSSSSSSSNNATSSNTDSDSAGDSRDAPDARVCDDATAAAAAAATPQLSGMTWKVCGGAAAGAPMLDPDSVTLAPDPPHHGRTMAVNVSGTSPISTSDGRLRVAVSYMGFKVYTYESALCEALQCPLVAGADFRLQVSQKLPSLAPPGSYSMEITGDDADGARFMCVQIAFHVAMPPGPGAAWRAAGGTGTGWGAGDATEEEEVDGERQQA